MQKQHFMEESLALTSSEVPKKPVAFHHLFMEVQSFQANHL
jgi:hypothetical protein